MPANPQITLYGAPRTRALRVAWFLEEIGLSYELRRVVFKPTSNQFFIQQTPTGKIPTLEDGETVLCESGAIIEYLAAKYGGGGMAPTIEEPSYGEYLQWFHFAESSAFAPLGVVVWLTVYRSDAEQHPELVKDARLRASQSLLYIEQRLAERDFLTGEFSAADIMMGFTLGAASQLGFLGELPNCSDYLSRITCREGYKTAYSKLHDEQV